MMISTDVRLVTYSALPDGDPDAPLMRNALREHGLSTDVAVWNDPRVDWSTARITLIRSTWDYHLDRAGFLEWAEKVALRTSLHNPPSLLRWNSHKSYLTDLDRRGLPIVPTVMVVAGEQPGMEQVVDGRGWREIVLKPAVSLDGHDVVRGRVSDPAMLSRLHAMARQTDVIVQPFVVSIVESGEWSIPFIDGVARHAVLKRPAAGDFRVQTRLGGTAVAADIPDHAVEIGSAALATLPEMPLYARVDLVEDQGRFCISELELIEPSLFLVLSPETAPHFATAIAARLRPGPAVTVG
jgi:glutathione synthase/RimK-type ligase-like ATP-grasp enzyme